MSPTAFSLDDKGREMFFEWKEYRSLPAESKLWVHASLLEGWKPGKGWDYSHTCSTHHLLYVSTTWCCTECNNLSAWKQVSPSSCFGSFSELSHHGHICLLFLLSQPQRFHSLPSFSHPHSPLHDPSIHTPPFLSLSLPFCTRPFHLPQPPIWAANKPFLRTKDKLAKTSINSAQAIPDNCTSDRLRKVHRSKSGK